MSYRIPILEASDNMDSYLTVNAPMVCAEDVVHAKLRKLYSDIPVQDGITVDPKELTLTEEDNRLYALDKDPNKDNELLSATGFNVQKRAKIWAEIMVIGRGKRAKEAVKQLNRDLKKMRLITPRGYKDGMTEEDKKKIDAANKIIDEQNAKIAQQKGLGEAEKIKQDALVTDAETTRTELMNQVHEYLEPLKRFDLTGETA